MPLFHTERDAGAYLALVEETTRDVVDWTVLAYCLMPNHVHLVVDASVPELSAAMHRINGLYAQRFNREHGYTGHLFQGRFHAKPISFESHLPGAIRYVVLNPVRAGLCRHPRHWRWSSYRACAGLEPAHRFLDGTRALALFGVDPTAARTAFVRFVDDALPTADDRGQSPGLSPALSGTSGVG